MGIVSIFGGLKTNHGYPVADADSKPPIDELCETFVKIRGAVRASRGAVRASRGAVRASRCRRKPTNLESGGG